MACGCMASGMAPTSSARFSSTCPSASMTSDIMAPSSMDRPRHHRRSGPSYKRYVRWAVGVVPALECAGIRRSGTPVRPRSGRVGVGGASARGARDVGGVGAHGGVWGAGRNRRVQLGSAIRHGETDAIENAGRLPAATYRRGTMYTTLSPCFMCAGTLLHYGVPRVVIGENATFLGAEGLLRQQGVELVNLDSAECRQLMREFITAEPAPWHEDIREEEHA